MFASRLSKVPLTAFVTTLSRPTLAAPIRPGLLQRCQGYARISRESVKRQTIKERALAPAGDGAFSIGKGFLAASSACGVGALCYYGLTGQDGAVDRAKFWPQYVKERIHSTYKYFGGSLVLTAASATAVFRTPALLNLVTKNGWVALIATMAAMVGSGMVARSIPYQPGTFGAKQLAWMAHCGILGAVVAPLAFLGGPILVRAAWYTAGIVGGLSTIAVCAPSEKFLYMGGTLGMGLGAVFVASLGGMFFPPTTALGAGLYSISMYGGLVVFGLFMLYDTQKIIKNAENHPMDGYSVQPFDPVNNAIGIYLDTINIFIRIAMLLANGGGKRRR